MTTSTNLDALFFVLHRLGDIVVIIIATSECTAWSK
jgi:hypothetical protein